ncbi:MAG: hypothetical protein AB8F74_19785 [Saprospiraceae bacterium]
MKALLRLLGWQFIILHKNNLINISIAVTVLYASIFFLIKDLPNVDQFLILLIYNDPAIIGFLFVGLSIIMEKDNNILPALFVTPINYHVYLLAKVLALSIIGWVCASGMALTLLGTDVAWLHFSAGVFGTCFVFSLVGIFVVSYTTEFLGFMLRSIPILVLFSLPFLNLFGATDIAILKLSPIQGALNLIAYSFGKTQGSISLVWSYGNLLFWSLLFYFGTYRLFVKRLVQSS